jgi:hypothetical protein
MPYCKRHPKIETALSCGKCGDPICPRCMVQTPVGMKCATCAGLSRLPTYRVSNVHYLIAIGAGLGMAVVCGLVWGLIQDLVPFFYLSFIIAGGVGYAIGEVVGLAVNRKRGTGLAVIGGLAVVLSYLVASSIFWGWRFSLFDLISVGIGVFVSVSRLR